MIIAVTTMPGFLELEPAWNALADRHRNPLLRHDWFAACIEAFCKPGRLRVMVLSDAQGVCAIAPLYETRTMAIPRLEALSNLAFEPTALLYRDEAALNELVAALVQHGQALWLNKFVADSTDAARLASSTTLGAWCFVRPTRGLASLPLPGPGTDIESMMSTARLSSLRRKRRRAERRGRIEFEVVTPDENNLEQLLGEVYRVEGSGWKRRNGTAILTDPRMERLCTSYARRAAARGVLRLCFLRIGRETAAVRMAVEHASALWELKIGYDERFSECSPGMLLTHETLRYACRQGMTSFEFLGSADSWQDIWRASVRQCSNFRIYPITPAGVSLMAVDIAAFGSRVGLEQSRAMLRHLLTRSRSGNRPRLPASTVSESGTHDAEDGSRSIPVPRQRSKRARSPS